ncbi:MAG: hypothetical protein GX444_11940 [Myxococcales bacterium]|nr:hypothetical protein [Myxococcales bacterium]
MSLLIERVVIGETDIQVRFRPEGMALPPREAFPARLRTAESGANGCPLTHANQTIWLRSVTLSERRDSAKPNEQAGAY